MERLDRMKEAIRKANHSPPSNGLFLSALIYAAAERSGAELEAEIMAPYRRDHPGEDRPR
jgi:hypothetical protein